ncbi:MAG: DUF1467 family protein [Rhodobacteraceae bacterium]|nr:DUF1467 family protein [Paracoccaceae bacterium]
MGITSAIVLYAVVWFLTLLIIAPIRIKTQGDLGEVVPGTHAGSPEIHNLKKKLWITSGVAFVIWAILVAVVVSGMITMRDIDFFNRMG